MVWAAVVIAKDGNYEVTSGKVVGLFSGLLIFHGALVRLACPLNGIPSLMTGILNAVLGLHRTVLRRAILQRSRRDSYSLTLARPLVRDSRFTSSSFSVLRRSIQSLLSSCWRRRAAITCTVRAMYLALKASSTKRMDGTTGWRSYLDY
jgi:hypothetical protein